MSAPVSIILLCILSFSIVLTLDFENPDLQRLRFSSIPVHCKTLTSSRVSRISKVHETSARWNGKAAAYALPTMRATEGPDVI